MTPTQRTVVLWALVLVTALTVKFIVTDKPIDSGLLLLLGTILGGVWGADAARVLQNKKKELESASREGVEEDGK
ncbi:hypothetical protein [Deinococcus cellulosilyticus]|uniref:Uncharacterized protein n=1 Tax=Deinococcus cellulosilyticus (strain DSM 18568 / NBRC 106333 / KACC 11606 / 5516J-15) TaxID=1223518 RepID=A0A511MZA1_DEIC1|nr:hypothetical protein [Deinococcus cellulosilyticus]GEM45924.1 hypothetical protein DC3_15590 [Deinococcus cellulosilyticus NBRC 106333 = KACC 11606]